MISNTRCWFDNGHTGQTGGRTGSDEPDRLWSWLAANRPPHPNCDHDRACGHEPEGLVYQAPIRAVAVEEIVGVANTAKHDQKHDRSGRSHEDS